MKIIKLSVFLLLAFGLFVSCSKDEVPNTELNSIKFSKSLAPQLNYDGHTKHCNKYGPTMKLNFSWDAGSNSNNTIFVDVTHINGDYIGTWSKSLTNTFDDFSMTIGYPPSGLKDCSLLLPKTKYIFHVWKYSGIPAAHDQLVPDFQAKTSFCICSE